MSENDYEEFGKQLKLFERMVVIETKLDSALARQNDHEGRMRVLENCAQKAEGAWKVMAGIGAIAGAFGGIAAKLLKL